MGDNINIKDFDIDKIMSDRKLFNETVYTPLSEAVKILEERQKDKELIKKIEDLLDGDIPEPLKKIDKYGISTKQVATPNHDTVWFLKLIKQFNLKPVFSEYLEDKFTSNNSFKHSLGVLHIDNGISSNGEHQYQKINIIDFKKYDGSLIKDVETKWGENLISFHKKLFNILDYNDVDLCFYDASAWLNRNGKMASIFYKKELLLYICHGILFENYLLSGDDLFFGKNVLLPAIKEIIEKTGQKPLIVPIPPMDVEEEQNWVFYDKKIMPYMKV